ncbi:MAG: exonuclease domain-containing protein [Bacteriovoracia bacterium]
MIGKNFLLDVFNQNVSDLRFVAFDTETTGLSSEVDEVVEISAIAFDEDFEQRRFESLVKPSIPIPSVAIEIHGITNEMVVGAPSFKEVITQFSEFLTWVGRPRVLLAHNAKFDLSFLKKNEQCVRHEITIDTCLLARYLLPELKSHSLQNLAKYFKISSDRFHRATADTLVLKEIFMQLLGIAADQGLFRVGDLVECCGGYFFGVEYCLSPQNQMLSELVGKEQMVRIQYGQELEVRYITPVKFHKKNGRYYLLAHCHRDEIQKTFKPEKIRLMR